MVRMMQKTKEWRPGERMIEHRGVVSKASEENLAAIIGDLIARDRPDAAIISVSLDIKCSVMVPMRETQPAAAAEPPKEADAPPRCEA